MKFNKWTLGLAAVGAVSLTSAVRADEAKITPLQTALSNTTISGYVDVAAQYNPGNVGASSAGSSVDSFSFNDVDIALDKPLDSTPWAAGYHAEFNLGNQAVGYPAGAGSGNYSAIRQAYVTMTTPVGNGITWKMGITDDVIGYEGNTDGANPNYTRSIGYAVEPTTLLGLLGTYQIISAISVTAGLAEHYSGGSESDSVSSKTFVGDVAFTAPDSWGWLKGGTLNIGALINPYKEGANNYYAGLTIPTPWSALKVGAAFDLTSVANEEDFFGENPQNDSGWVVGLYGSVQATDKLSFNLRGEYYDFSGYAHAEGNDSKGEELTATVQYNLWANVISRAEFRWDHADQGTAGFYNATDNSNSYLLALNVIYSF